MMRTFRSKYTPTDHYIPYRDQMQENQQVKLGGPDFHPDAVEQICYIQKPKGIHADCTTLVYFHGGGCLFGSAEDRTDVVIKLAVKTNCVVVNCNYRKAPESKFPLPIFDAYAILKQLIKDAESLGINASKIAFIGESGGATILLGVAQFLVERGEQDLVQLLIPMWPMCGDNLCGGKKPDWTQYEKPFHYMDRFYEAICTDFAAQQTDGYVYPVRMQDHVMAKLPMTFVLTSEFDCYRRDSSKLAQRLASFGRL
jgi:acetyl esterase